MALEKMATPLRAPDNILAGIAQRLICPKGQIVLVIVALCVHLPFVLWYGMGEQDQARFILDALQWKAFGEPFGLAYRARTSPLYILLLYGVAKIFGLNTNGLIAFTTALSFIAGLAIIPLFLRISHEIGLKALSSLSALFLLELMPVFWFSSLYGFATLPSMAVFLGALLCYCRYCGEHGVLKRLVWLFCTMILFTIAALLKIDNLVCGSALFGLALLNFKHKRLWVETAGLLVIAIAAYMTGDWCSVLTNAQKTTGGSFWRGTFSTYPLVPFYFLHPSRILSVFRAYGICIVLLAFLSMTIQIPGLIRRARLRRQMAFCVLWSMPLFFFWVSHEAINARELLCTAPGIALMVGLLIEQFPSWKCAVVIFLAWVGSLLAVRPTSQAFFPSARLLKSSRMFNEYHRQMRCRADEFIDIKADKKMLVGGEMVPYFQAYVFARSWTTVSKVSYPGAFAGYRCSVSGMTDREFLFYYGRPDRTYLDSATVDGYTIVGFEEEATAWLGKMGVSFVTLRQIEPAGHGRGRLNHVINEKKIDK